MKLAIMQPYLFPYLGYWQLMNYADKFVILDDVNFIKRGYINRNSVLVNGKPYLFSVPLDHPSQNKLIMQIHLNFSKKDREAFLKTLYLAYKKAPCFESVYSKMEEIIYCETDDLTSYIENSFHVLCDYMNIQTPFVRSSEVIPVREQKGEQHIIQICERLGADTYINPIGGVDLYHAENFQQKNITLNFLEMNHEIKYTQFANEFVSNLSVIDVLMFNSKSEVAGLLNDYTLY